MTDADRPDDKGTRRRPDLTERSGWLTLCVGLGGAAIRIALARVSREPTGAIR